MEGHVADLSNQDSKKEVETEESEVETTETDYKDLIDASGILEIIDFIKDFWYVVVYPH